MKRAEKKKTWMKFRHRVIRVVAGPVMWLYTRLKYRIRVEKFRDEEKRPYLILLNHQTPFDQFFVGLAFRQPVYYMATEDIFSMGWISKLIRWAVAPIPIKKQTTDVQAVMNCMKIAREGGTICIAPEGNRTYNGRTVYMNPAIAPLVKKLNLPVALYRLEGGYGAEPRWSDVVRRGKMRGYVSRVIQPEELAAMSKEELYEAIREGLDVREDCVTDMFYHKKSAEYAERCLYVCHKCGLSNLRSENDLITCPTCGTRVRYLPSKELEGVDEAFPFRFIHDWYQYQCDYVNQMDTTAHTQTPLFQDTVRLSEVIVYERKQLLREKAQLSLYGDRIAVDAGTDRELVMPFADISMVTVLGRNKLNIYFDKTVYQVKGEKRFNALKYMNFFFRYKNIAKGDENETFLGL